MASWLIRALTLGLLAIILPLAARGLYGAPGAAVNIRWQSSVDAVERQRLEDRVAARRWAGGLAVHMAL